MRAIGVGHDEELERILSWRELQFLDLGCGQLLARRLAEMTALDLGEFRNLVAAGAKPKTAARILLPEDF